MEAPPPTPRSARLAAWLRAHAPGLIFALLLVVPTGADEILLLGKRPR